MSTYTVEKLPGEPIVVTTPHEGFELKREVYALNAEAQELFDTLDRPGFFIVETRGASLDFEDIMASTATVVDGTSLFFHPNVIETLIVTTDEMMRLSAEGFGSEAFGNAPIQIFTSLEDALEYARANL